MNLLDILIGIILALAGIAGYYWGLVRQILALAGLAAGLAVAGRYGSDAADALMSFTASRAVAEVGGALTLLALVSGSASLLASLLQLYVGLIVFGKPRPWAGRGAGCRACRAADHGAGAGHPGVSAGAVGDDGARLNAGIAADADCGDSDGIAVASCVVRSGGGPLPPHPPCPLLPQGEQGEFGHPDA
jgi:hypothetical protein